MIISIEADHGERAEREPKQESGAEPPTGPCGAGGETP